MKRLHTSSTITWRTEHFCLVCGERGKNTGCCDDPLCWATLIMYPDIKDGADVKRCTGSVSADPKAVEAKKREKMIHRAGVINSINTGVAAAPIAHGGTVKTETRPDYRKQGEQPESPWAHVSPKFCLFHKQADKEDEIGLKLTRPKKGNVRRRIAKSLGGEDYLEEFDYILAWRCGCSRQTTVLYRELKEIPIRPGRYGICPICNAAALKIVEE